MKRAKIKKVRVEKMTSENKNNNKKKSKKRKPSRFFFFRDEADLVHSVEHI